MQKVPGVVSVKVSLNEGLTVLDLQPENTVTLANLRQIIRNNGFTTPESRVVARGSVASSAGALFFDVRGTKERLAIVGATPAAADVVVTGSVDMRDAKSFRVTVASAAAP